MKIGDEIYVHGYVEEIRQDKVIIRNDGGYFRTALSETREATQEECEGVDEYISRISEDVPDIGVGKMYNPQGRTESSMTLLGDVLKEAYCSGYADGLSDRIESDYDRGYEAAKDDLDLIPCQQADKTSDKAYKDGMDAAWNAARKICSGQFTGKLDTGMILNISASDAIEKIKEYEAEERAKDLYDRYDIPAEQMTEDQLRQAVKDLSMDMNEWVRRSTVPAAKAFDFVADLARKGIDCYQHAIKDGKVLIEWGRKEDGETLQQAAQRRTRPVHCGAQGPGGLQEETGCGE